ncbi:MAG: AMIN domain-containing protein [Betaproteobacteria bacterium]|nr:AMIN domain-containing protein [Betaproteobacteria bacterium]
MNAIKINTGLLAFCAAALLIAAPLSAFAQIDDSAKSASESAQAVSGEKNAITAIEVAPHGNAIFFKIDLRSPTANLPAIFSVANPPRIAMDFTDVENALGQTQREVKEGDLTSFNVITVGGRTRVLLNLVRAMRHEVRQEGNSLLVTLTPLPGIAASGKSSPFVTETIAGAHAIHDVTFRRGQEGEARILVELSDAGTGINIRQQGRSLVVDFLRTSLPENLRRKMDVTDFGTPVTQVVTESKGANVQMTITPKGLWEHNAYQADNQFVVEVKAIIEDPNKLVQSSKIGYQGPRISINYQNGDVRALLRLMAEELDLNAVISETVTGTTTLVLKDVPADQVIDIIFQQKGLDMRKNGNVILIAPRDEIDTREKLIYESMQTKEDLEPLVTETFQLNYHDVKAFTAMLVDKDQRVLSKRGNVMTDPRSNMLFVQDIPSRLEELRRIIALTDIPKRQVMIEARIVEATEWFAKSLGMRLGVFHSKLIPGRGWYGMAGNNIDTLRNFSGQNYEAALNNYNDARSGYGQLLANRQAYNNWVANGMVGDAPDNPSDFQISEASRLMSTSASTLSIASQRTNPYGGIPETATFPGMNQVNLPAGGLSGPISGQTMSDPSLFSLLVSNSAGTRMLNLEISALESDNKGKVISSPRILTTDQEEALIEQGVEIPYQEASSSGATSVQFKKAVMSLRVTPRITPDGRVSMKINVNQDSKGADVPGGVSINTKKVETTALVENGGTIVIGGIYEMASSNKVEKVPLLGDIPVLGNLFKNSGKQIDKRELLVFITPKIVSETLTVSN